MPPSNLCRHAGATGAASPPRSCVTLAAAAMTRDHGCRFQRRPRIIVALACSSRRSSPACPSASCCCLPTATYLWGSGRRAAGGAAADHGQRHRQLHSTRHTVLHPRRPDHGARRHQRAAGALHPHAGRPLARRAAAGHGRQHVCGLRPFRLEARRRRRRRHGHARPIARASRRGRRRGRPRRVGDHGRDRAAEHRHAHRRLDHQRVGRRHVYRRPDPRGGDGALPDDADLRARPRAGAPRRRAPVAGPWPGPDSARSCHC